MSTVPYLRTYRTVYGIPYLLDRTVFKCFNILGYLETNTLFNFKYYSEMAIDDDTLSNILRIFMVVLICIFMVRKIILISVRLLRIFSSL